MISYVSPRNVPKSSLAFLTSRSEETNEYRIKLTTIPSQKIPIHGIKHAKARPRPQRQDPRHPQNARDGAVLEIERCTYCSSRSFRLLLRHLWSCVPPRFQRNIKQPSNISLQDDAEPLETSFELNDTLFAKANIEKVNEVYLWLGVSLHHYLSLEILICPTSHLLQKPPCHFFEYLRTSLTLLSSSIRLANPHQPGQRDALLPDPRSRRPPHKQAGCRPAESEQLRRRPRFLEGASHRKSLASHLPFLPP